VVSPVDHIYSQGPWVFISGVKSIKPVPEPHRSQPATHIGETTVSGIAANESGFVSGIAFPSSDADSSITNRLSAATEYVGRQGLAVKAAQQNAIIQAVIKVETFI
jgi:hypothetical protein